MTKIPINSVSPTLAPDPCSCSNAQSWSFTNYTIWWREYGIVHLFTVVSVEPPARGNNYFILFFFFEKSLNKNSASQIFFCKKSIYLFPITEICSAATDCCLFDVVCSRYIHNRSMARVNIISKLLRTCCNQCDARFGGSAWATFFKRHQSTFDMAIRSM